MLESLLILLLIAAGQGFFMSIYLVSQWKKNPANVFLGFLFLFLSLSLFDLVLLSSYKAMDYPHLVFWSAPLNLAFGPLLYLYIRGNETSPNKHKRRFLHLIPFVLHLLYVVWVYHAQPLDYKLDFLDQFVANKLLMDGPPPATDELLFTYFIYAHFALYLWQSKRALAKKGLFSVEKLRLLNPLWWALMVIGLFGLIQLEFLVFDLQPTPITGYIASFIAVLYIYTGALVVFKRPGLIFPALIKPKYQSSTLDEEAKEELIEQLKAYMKDHQPYLDSEFNLKKLAEYLDTPGRHISQAINEQLGQNFSDFVNGYRVEAFKAKLNLTENQHLSMLGIAMDCGFKSKSTFNTTFKRLTGLTPSEYKNSLK